MIKKKTKKKQLPRLNITGLLFLLSVIIAMVVVLEGTKTIQYNVSRAASMPADTTKYLIKINQPSPRFGDTVNFTAVYPREAEKKIGRQQMFQPQIQVLCSQNGARVLAAISTTVTKNPNVDGTITGISGDVHLGGFSSILGNQYYWTGGAAECVVNIVYYTTKSLNPNFVASSQFSVTE